MNRKYFLLIFCGLFISLKGENANVVDISPFVKEVIPSCFPIVKDLPYVSLNYVIQYTLSHQRGIQIAYADTVIAYGDALQSAGPFDTMLESSYQEDKIFDAQDANTYTPLEGHESRLSARVTKKTREGTRGDLSMNIERIENPARFPPFDISNTATIAFRITQPLAKDFEFGLERMDELAFIIEAQAARLEALNQISDLILKSVEGYWNVVAAQGFLSIREDSVNRFVPLVENTQKLINGDQLAPNEINQPLAQLSQERSRKMQAMEDYYAAMRDLKLRMGYDVFLDPCTLILIDHSFTAPNEFLPPHIDPCQYKAIQERLISLALKQRLDLLAANVRVEARRAALKGADNARLPQLDVFAGVVVSNSIFGIDAQTFFSALHFKQAQKNYQLGVQFFYPLENSEASGRYVRRNAELMRQMLTRDQLEQDIISSVQIAWSNHIQLIQRLTYVNLAIERYRVLVENERKKLVEGFSTLFTLIDFENRLTDTYLEKVDVLRSIAINLARLYTLTGSLYIPDACKNIIEIGDLTSYSLLESKPLFAKKKCSTCYKQRP